MTSLVYQPISQLSTLNFGASTYLPPYNLPAHLPRRCARNPTLGAREVTSGRVHHHQQPPACCIALRRSKAHGVERFINTKILFVRFNVRKTGVWHHLDEHARAPRPRPRVGDLELAGRVWCRGNQLSIITAVVHVVADGPRSPTGSLGRLGLCN